MQAIMDSVWVLVSAFLVFFMHAGFALVESGFCRRKNVVMVLLKNVAVVSVASLLFYLVGFGLMFGGGSVWLGLDGFAPAADAAVANAPDGLPLFVFLFFQLVFAATAATIVSGAVAERVSLPGFLIFTSLASAVLYPIAGHWVWGGGYLAAETSFHDFAGSTVVHAVGGGMALAGVMVIGARHGRFDEKGRPRPMPAHSFPLAALGVLVLWLGWFGFNGGSTLAADPDAIAPVILVTNLAAAGGFLAALVHTRLRTGGLDLSMALNGALAGLVSITAGADVIGPLESMLVGVIGGVLVVEGVFLLDKLKLDDPVGAIPVHLFCGVFGTLAVGLFADAGETAGLLHGGGVTLLAHQALGVLMSVAFAFVVGFALWMLLKKTVGVRVSTEHEVEGLDLAECGVEAYGRELPGLGLSSPEPRPEKTATPRLERAAQG
ncbi:MAG TPA: ammonium transporter [Sandaracinaceae bacterium LLY-WYZ-13_1]|nr:ammonium transporter [Sandaracinaceae bacterium LLY-WYZ-13_1]